MTNWTRRAWQGTIDVVFPRCCVACANPVDRSWLRHVCADCAAQIHLVHEPHCSTCGHPFYGEVEGDRLCPHCETLVPRFGRGKTAILLKGPGRMLVHALKYHAALHVLQDIETVVKRVPGYLDFVRGSVLVPVPLHRRKLRERGYNQSVLLAETLGAAAAGGTSVEELLRREIDTESQTHFDRATRQRNLKNAFAPAPGAVINPALHYLLIDDVFTTGSTLNACAAVLRRAGALNLDVVTFGHG